MREGRDLYQSPSSSEVIMRRREIKIPLSAKGGIQDNWPELHQ